MYKYHCLNPIADIGLNNFTEDYTKIDTAEGADALLVRSQSAVLTIWSIAGWI